MQSTLTPKNGPDGVISTARHSDTYQGKAVHQC